MTAESFYAFWKSLRAQVMRRWWVFYAKRVSHRPPLQTRAGDWVVSKLLYVHRWLLPERQVIVRSKGSVRFVRLSHGVQFAVLLIAVTLAGWGGYATHAFFAKDRILAEKNERIAEALVAYRKLLDQYAVSQSRFASAARSLEQNHSYLLGIVEPEAAAKAKRDHARLRGDDEEIHMVGLKDILQANKQLESWMAEIYASQHDVVRKLTDKTHNDLSKTKTLISGLGIDVERALSEETVAELGQGGPFIALRPDRSPEDSFRADLAKLDTYIDRWEGVQRLLRALPLATPLNRFYVASRYGSRKDPFNGRPAMHYGMDLSGVFKSPVLSTAPGIVVFVGRNGKYGKMVEIDHGRGIHTRYGHLHKILVKIGQRVDFRERIGLLGSTGRSTGPHVHYEIRVNDTPYNPQKFFKVGRHVFKDWEG
ncbi:MAG: M23 family metallopeptidase [Alphaproteobacteria bacterium]|nr:M23 family metallopeptidase [Alphaproteobacteria bacterium]